MKTKSGWIYRELPLAGDEPRKLVTLETHSRRWVTIRIWNEKKEIWMNGIEPENQYVLAWKNLEEPAKGFYVHGEFVNLE